MYLGIGGTRGVACRPRAGNRFRSCPEGVGKGFFSRSSICSRKATIGSGKLDPLDALPAGTPRKSGTWAARSGFSPRTAVQPFVFAVGVEILDPQPLGQLAGRYRRSDLHSPSGSMARLTEGEVGPRGPGPRQVTALGRAGHRQQQIGIARLGGHEQLVDREELQGLQGPGRLVAVAGLVQVVVAHGPSHADVRRVAPFLPWRMASNIVLMWIRLITRRRMSRVPLTLGPSSSKGFLPAGMPGVRNMWATGSAHEPAAGAAARPAHVAGHGAQGGGAAVVLLAHGAARRPLAVHEGRGLGGGILPGQGDRWSRPATPEISAAQAGVFSMPSSWPSTYSRKRSKPTV